MAKAKKASGKKKSAAKSIAKSTGTSRTKSNKRAAVRLSKKLAKKPAKLAAKKAPAKVSTTAKAKAGTAGKVKAGTAGKVKAKSTTPVHKKSAPDLKFWAGFVTPLDDRLIVEVRAGEKVTAGGLIIPDTAITEGNTEGVVLVVGRGHRGTKGKIKTMDVKAGDHILFAAMSGAKAIILDKSVRIIRESEVLGIIEG